MRNLPSSLPVVAALATVIAALIAGVVALVVAWVNAWSARRTAIDAAHREFRRELSESATKATRSLLAQIHALEQIQRERRYSDWRETVAKFQSLSNRRAQLDLRVPHDPVFAEAIKVFRQRRAQFELWLIVVGGDMPAFGLSEATSYIREAAEIVQLAAEAYVFGVRAPRNRAQQLLSNLSTLPLKTRIDLKVGWYSSAFEKNGDARNLMEISDFIDERPLPVAVCRECGAFAISAEVINQRCARELNGKRCKGVYVGALRPNDWSPCSVCSGNGQSHDRQCDVCQGTGWRFTRFS